MHKEACEMFTYCKPEVLSYLIGCYKFGVKVDRLNEANSLEKYFAMIPPNVVMHIMSYLTDRELCNAILSGNPTAVRAAEMTVKSRSTISVAVFKGDMSLQSSCMPNFKAEAIIPHLNRMKLNKVTVVVEKGVRLNLRFKRFLSNIKCSVLHVQVCFKYASLLKLVMHVCSYCRDLCAVIHCSMGPGYHGALLSTVEMEKIRKLKLVTSIHLIVTSEVIGPMGKGRLLILLNEKKSVGCT